MTGKQIWNFTTGDEVRSSPAVVYGHVYVGSFDGKLYCLDETTGALIWESFTTGDWVISSPAVANGYVYIGSIDNKLYCFEANYSVCVWSFTAGGDVRSSPAVVGDRVYVGSWDGKMYCLNATTGEVIWSYTTGYYVSSDPAIANGKIYFGSCDRNIYCLNATNGELIWNYTTRNYVISSPAVVDGYIYIGTDEGKMYCLDANTGEPIWNYTTDTYIWIESSPAFADGKIYFGSCDCYVYCLNATTGDLIWNYPTHSMVYSSPAVANKHVYIGSYDRNVYCFGPQNYPPTYGTPSPINASSDQPTSLTWSIPINDPEGDAFSWTIHCSNGQTNTGTNEHNGSKAIALTGLAYTTTYTVWVNATDPIGSTTYTRAWFTFKTNQPPDTPTITGPAKGKIKVTTTYNITTTDLDGDHVYYLIDWGDGTNTTWLGDYPSGQIIKQTHTWTKKGSYTIKAKAKDIHGAESNWSTLSVTMPLSYEPQSHPFLTWLLQQFPHAFPLLRHFLNGS